MEQVVLGSPPWDRGSGIQIAETSWRRPRACVNIIKKIAPSTVKGRSGRRGVPARHQTRASLFPRSRRPSEASTLRTSEVLCVPVEKADEKVHADPRRTLRRSESGD